MMKQIIDVVAHIMPPKYAEALYKHLKAKPVFHPRSAEHDLQIRLRMGEQHEGYVQILSILTPAVEDITDSPKVAAELARIANDEMADLVRRYPDKFIAAIACLPMNDMDAVLKEVDRTILELGFRGVQFTSNIMDKPIDSAEFAPLFEKMNFYNLPMFMHPRMMLKGPRALSKIAEDKVDEAILGQVPYGWPLETTMGMGRIVFGGMLDKYPNLKIITHHCGGLTPYQANRISMRAEGRFYLKHPRDYFKMMYGDTAVWGNTAILMCGYDFFGADHLVFATDITNAEAGVGRLVGTIRSVDEMDIPEEDKKKIFEDNARAIFRLPDRR